MKVYAAYKAATEHKGSPTVILAQTIKGYGLGEAGEGRNITHQQLTAEACLPAAKASEPAQSVDIDEIVEWLENLWLEEGEIGNAISEQEWQEFIDSVKASVETEN